jgi:glycosyltransferase involved in cell wall biosynthesis
MVTYQDSTLAQALRSYPWPHLRGLSANEIERELRRQRAAYASAVGCCVLSHWAAQSLAADYGLPPEKIHVVGLGANHVIDGAQVVRDWSHPRFLFVGLDWERKNGPGLLRAFARFHEEVPEATLDLVGGHPRIDHPGVRGHGPLRLGDPAGAQKLADLYRSATVFVLPSLHEPSGTVHVEAAAAGIPSIGSASGGAATGIGDSGLIVDGRSADELLDAMRKLAVPTVAQALGERALERARLFTWRQVAERLVRALRVPGVDDSSLADFLPDLEESSHAPR